MLRVRAALSLRLPASKKGLNPDARAKPAAGFKCKVVVDGSFFVVTSPVRVIEGRDISHYQSHLGGVSPDTPKTHGALLG